MQDIHIHSCGHWFGGGEIRLRTILGSCVAITLWHPGLRVGGLCHFMIAKAPASKRGAAPGERDGCYGDLAMALLQREIAAYGLLPGELEAKLFGGGQMLPCPDDGSGGCLPSKVQAQNIAAGRELVARFGHPLVAEHLGGHGHRNLVFDLTTGLAWLKHTPGDCGRCRRPAQAA